MQYLSIVSESEKKSRSFGSFLASTIIADELWSGGEATTEHIRPVFLILTSTEQELRFFTTNLKCGNLASFPRRGYGRKAGDQLELLKTAGYKYIFQKNIDLQGASAVTIYLPQLIEPEPSCAIDGNSCKFVCLTPQAWYTQQLAKISDEQRIEYISFIRSAYTAINLSLDVIPDIDIINLLPIAARFSFYLDRRIPYPIIADMKFYLLLLFEFLRNKAASLVQTNESSSHYYQNSSTTDPWIWARNRTFSSFEAESISDFGFLQPIACNIATKDLKDLLSSITYMFINGSKK